MKSTENWVQTGRTTKFSHNTTPDLITSFNKCSLLPLIELQIGNYTAGAIVDSGASRCLISSSMAQKVWGHAYQNKISPFSAKLHDVNNQIINTSGSLVENIRINQSNFTQEFIIYESNCAEILLGFNFLKHHQIAIFPNLGLVHESLLKIYKINEQTNMKCTLSISEDVTINGEDQQMVQVYLSNISPQIDQQLYPNGTWLAHSEDIESGEELDKLTVLHQYINVAPTLTANILLINHSNAPVFYPIDTIIAHLEPTEIIANARQIQEDPLLYAIYSCFQDSEVQPPESRIFADIDKFQFDPLDINCASENPENVEWLKNLHNKYKTIFNSEEFSPGKYRGSEVHFSLKENATIINQRFQRVNPAILEDAQIIINNLLKRGLIAVSDTPYSSRVLFVRKAAPEIQKRDLKDGQDFVPGEKIHSKQKRKLRMVIDMRFINERLKTSHTTWVTPSIWCLLADFQDIQYISSIDLNSGFWHFPLSKKCSQYTGFDFNGVRYICLRMPQGLRISSTVMMSKMKKFIIRHNLVGIKIYIDNILVIGKTLKEYKDNLEAFFKACLEENFIIKMKKSHHFIHHTFNVFGYEINLQLHTISPEKAKVSKILEIPIPNTKRKIKQFIGAVSYFGNMIEQLQVILAPLHTLAAPKTKFLWDEQCQSAFDTVKNHLRKLPFIHIYNTQLPVHAFCDAAQFSHVAYSLFQFSTKHDTMLPIRYNSHKLNDSESHLSQIEVEALALMFCLAKEEQILSFNNGVLHTDARSLTYIMRFSNATSKIARWNLILRSYDISVVFTPNTHALISFTDLMTRGNFKPKYKNKITQEDLNHFLQINYHGLPQLTMTEALDVIEKSIQMVGPLRQSKKSLNMVKLVMPAPPPRSLIIAPHARVYFASGELVGRVTTSIDFSVVHNKENKLIPPLPPLSGNSVKLESGSTIQTNNLKINIAMFMPEISIKLLATLQHNDPNFDKIFKGLEGKKSYQHFFLHEKILFRKARLSNNICVDQIALPQKLAQATIKRFHEQNYFKHLGVLGMKRHLQPIFYIRNFVQIAEKIIQSCVFCSYNKVYPNRKLRPGFKLLVDGPKKFVAMDICCIRSGSKNNSFLTIVDIFTRYCIFLPIDKDATAKEILDKFVQNWVRYFGFPASLTVDGATNFTNKLLGAVAANLNIKICRIAPYNSRSNISERYNKFAIMGVRIFHQSYGITDDNFGIILSLIGQMLNSQKLANGYSPFYLMMGSEPNIPFITFQTVSRESKLSEHCKNILRAQNVCYAIQSQQKQLEKNENKEVSQYHQFQPGTFVLLRKLGVEPGHMKKGRPVYHKEPFRILKRTETNAIIVPFGLGYLKQRFKYEGDIPKNLCTMQRLTHLKPIPNPFKLLKLSLPQKMLLDLNLLLQSEISDVSAVEIITQQNIDKPSNLFQDFNASIQFLPGKSMKNLEPQCKNPQVIHPLHQESIKDINKVQLHSLDHTFSESEFYVKTNTTEIAPIKKKIQNPEISAFTSSKSGSPPFSFEFQDSYFEDEDYLNSNSESSSSHSQIFHQLTEISPTPSQATSVDDIRVTGVDFPETSRPTLSAKKTTRNITRISLPTGRYIDLSNDTNIPRIKDYSSSNSTVSRPRLSIQNKPKTVIKDSKHA